MGGAYLLCFTFRNIVQAMQDKGAGVMLYEFEGRTKSKMTKPYVKGKGWGPVRLGTRLNVGLGGLS